MIFASVQIEKLLLPLLSQLVLIILAARIVGLYFVRSDNPRLLVKSLRDCCSAQVYLDGLHLILFK